MPWQWRRVRPVQIARHGNPRELQLSLLPCMDSATDPRLSKADLGSRWAA